VFRHVVVFTWAPGSAPEQRDSAVAALREWVGQAAGYGTVSVGVDAGLAEGNGDVAVVVDLPDKETYLAYAADDRHQALLRDHVRPILATRAAVQYEL
jgi:hypothetical protein